MKFKKNHQTSNTKLCPFCNRHKLACKDQSISHFYYIGTHKYKNGETRDRFFTYCRQCNGIKERMYREANRDAILARRRKNSHKYRERRREYDAKHAEIRKARNREYIKTPIGKLIHNAKNYRRFLRNDDISPERRGRLEKALTESMRMIDRLRAKKSREQEFVEYA